jgi:hypothetical protein
VKKECVSWVNNRYKDNSAKDAALKDMSSHFLVIAFLPFHAAEVRQEIKHWGDTKGFMTQCIVSIPRHFDGRGFTSPTDHYSAKRMRALLETSSTTSISITSV